MSDTDDHRDAVRMTQRHLQTATTGWSVGSFGVIAEFHRDADDTVDFTPTPGGGIAITDKGAVQVDLTDGVRVLPYETPSRNRARWNQGVNICLPNGPAGRMAARTGLTEVGPDVGAVRELDRNAILFDLGLALPHVDACVRTTDPTLIETLRAHPGADMLDFDGPAMAAVIAASQTTQSNSETVESRIAICTPGADVQIAVRLPHQPFVIRASAPTRPR